MILLTLQINNIHHWTLQTQFTLVRCGYTNLFLRLFCCMWSSGLRCCITLLLFDSSHDLLPCNYFNVKTTLYQLGIILLGIRLCEKFRREKKKRKKWKKEWFLKKKIFFLESALNVLPGTLHLEPILTASSSLWLTLTERWHTRAHTTDKTHTKR